MDHNISHGVLVFKSGVSGCLEGLEGGGRVSVWAIFAIIIAGDS